jgi:hypothetical protein
MKRIFLPLVVILISFSSVVAQQEKVVYGENVQKREISSFHSIETSSGIEVIISKGDKEELAVSASESKFLPEVRTVVENGKLKISRSSDWNLWNSWKNWKIKVYVSYNQLDEIKATSGGSVTGTEVKLNKLFAHLNSGGFITLTGTVESLIVEGNSGAQFKGYALQTSNCKAEVSSGAGIQITVNKEISAKANSGGFVHFKGEGMIRDINVNSGGSVKRQN